MSVNIQTLGIDQLSIPDRLELIDQIWDTLPDDITDEVPEWHLAELKMRRRQHDAEPDAVKPWREALDSIEGNA